MATLLFVHGTGVRSTSYETSLAQVRLGMSGAGIPVAECLWGDPLGVHLHAGGASIPSDMPHLAASGVTEDDELVALWSVLYQDPLYELRLLQSGGAEPAQVAPGARGGGFVPGLRSPADVLQEKAQGLANPGALAEEGRSALVATGFPQEELVQAAKAVLGSPAYQAMLQRVREPLTPYRRAIARAIVASLLADRPGGPQDVAMSEAWGMPAAASLDGALRDRLVDAIAAQLGAPELGLGTWLKDQFTGLATRWSTGHVRRNRRALSQSIYPGVGDILLYQTRGQAMRDFIRARIEAEEGPMILLGHSLGGIMCVDLLVQHDLSQRVKLLVTVGSQAPFLYELNTLTSLRWREVLPQHFPRWLNVYDRRDFLSYVGAGVFPGRVRDEAVDSRQPFPQAHSAYWTTGRLWNLIREEWKEVAV